MIGEPPPLTRIRIAGVPEHFNLPWLLALERRAFVRVNIDLKWSTVPEGTGRMCAMLREGEVDLAIMVTEGAVRDILNGNPSRIVSHYVDTPLTWGVHVGAHTSIATADQLKGVPFAISRINSGSHLAAMTYAQAHGWTPKEKDLIVVNDLAGAIERLKAPEPCAFLWEKFTTKSLVDNGTLRRVDEHVSPWPSFVIVATVAILAEHSKDIARLLKVIRDQAAGLMQKKAAPEMIAQRYTMSDADAREWFSAVKWNTDGKVDGEALERVARKLVGAGMLSSDLLAGLERRFSASM
ncbi:MAG TPA: ABC transporter substrate-binding protein [Flavobacteriales bacterium]|nr:ABC transporter substrate-binding protein [Flavobacteriales bacterium]